jgi:hypothetical protein
VFSWNKFRCYKWEGIADIGGSGYSLDKVLPPKIDKIKPKINLGFVTRGCIRKCHFCIVPEKEGRIHEVGDIYDLWDGKGKSISLMDNNILALPKTFFKICRQLKKENLKVDFNQGLDHRLLTDKICKVLLSLKISAEAGNKIRFAYDDIAYKPTVLKALKMLKRHGMKDWNTRWYVYVGTKDTVATVLERVNLLKKWNQAVFLMRDRDATVMANKEYAKIYSWTSTITAFAKVSYDEYKASHKNETPDYMFRE